MKKLRLSFVFIALLGAAACNRTSSPDSARSRDDLGKLQGTWRIESSMWNGVSDPEVAKSVTIIFRHDKFICVDRDGQPQEETIKLMPDQNPKAIDSWSKASAQAAPGIYSIEGDVFKWCSAAGGNKVRPSEFASKPGSKQSLMVLRRTKS
jgi:uncharacterized protein (TIGR03067 family)